MFRENTISREQLIDYAGKRFQSLGDTQKLYQRFLNVRQDKVGVVSNISKVATALLTYQSKLPKDSISDYECMQLFFVSMQIKLRQMLELWFDNVQIINSPIRYAERQDAMLSGTGVYMRKNQRKRHITCARVRGVQNLPTKRRSATEFANTARQEVPVEPVERKGTFAAIV